MSDLPWYVLKLRNDVLAVRTLKRLSLTYLYPQERVRRPRKPDLVAPVYPGYALVSFDAAGPIPLRFEHSRSWVWWQQLPDLPGVDAIFHDGLRPLPVRDEIGRFAEDSVTEQDWTEGLRPGDVRRVRSGPFAMFMATVRSLDHVNGRVNAEVSIFGRSTPVTYEVADLAPV